MSDYASQFRLLVDHLDAADPEDQLVFFRMLDLVKTEVVQELSPRLLLASSPVPFRMLVAEAAYFFPSPGWIQPLCRALRREADPGVYGVCVRALARIGTPESNEELRLLSSITHEPVKRELLSLALHSSDPDRAFEHHLGRLFGGSSNPNIANQAAAELRQIVGPDHLEKLMVAVYHEDLLIARHILKLITYVSSWEAAQFLCSYFLECHQDILDDRILKENLASLRPLSPAELWPALVAQVESRFEDRVPGALTELKAAGVEGGSGSLEAVEALRNWARGTVEPFLLDALVLLLEGKAARLATLFADALSALQARARRTPHSLDTCATGLELMVARGFFVAEDVLDLLYQAFLAQTGREATARVLGTLLAPTDITYLEAILATHDSALRAAALDSIAARRDARFLSFLLKACRDPIEDVAGRMILAAGGLEGAEEQALVYITSRAPEEVALGLRLVRMNRMTALSSQVLAFLDANTREDLSLDAVAVLGDFATADAALLKHLHSGQSARMQTALAEALAGRDPSGTALELARLALTLHQPEVWLAAASGLIRAWESAGPMPLDVSEVLLNLVQTCWKVQSGSLRARLIQALQGFQTMETTHSEAILALLVAIVDDKRAQAGWGPEQLNQLTVTIRHLRRGA
ncbi:MAG: hypothetical protein IPN59_16185 [Holophaga sp.]|nr:hypothetical protein [Holophaga sp.]